MNQLQIGFQIEPDEQIGTTFVSPEIRINHVPFPGYGEYVINFQALQLSITEPSEFFILTCICGEPECIGIFDGIYVRHTDDAVQWFVDEPFFPTQTFTFLRTDYQKAIEKGLHALAEWDGRPDFTLLTTDRNRAILKVRATATPDVHA